MFAAATCLATPAIAADGGTVEITVTNVRSDAGAIMVQLCDRAHFLGKCAIGSHAPAQKGSVTVTFHNVPPGDYAALAFHDANGDGALNRWLGIPKEDFGLSGLKGLPLRPPRFKDSVFTHGAADQKMAVKLGNYFG
ncbi:MAG: hypothetical protein DI605_17720 [Sphingomonas sp.]|nr:MAG: hypothetical protein DI605_17720 [Sphingomonas sp.]